MAAIKRLIFVVGFLPVAIYSMCRWVVTGKDPLEGIATFERRLLH